MTNEDTTSDRTDVPKLQGKVASGNEQAAALKADQHVQIALDEALQESFPASDPVAITIAMMQKKIVIASDNETQRAQREPVKLVPYA